MRFNPPPNWESIRPGWTPPQGWQPDETYPPIPDGWQIWVEEDEEDPSRRKTAIVVGAIVAIAIAVAIVLWIVSIAGNKSAEDQIRGVLDSAQSAFNSADAAAYAEAFCPGAFDGGPPLAATLQADRAANGEAAYTIDNLLVSGETATARLTVTFANGPVDAAQVGPNVEFQELDGDWKICTTIKY